MYYLKSRYYNPSVGRFINADSQLNPGLFGFNRFCYCDNNPIYKSDSTGKWFGIDDVFTGPVDELIIIGLLAFLAGLGVGWAQDAASDLSSILSNTFKSSISIFSKSTTEDRLTGIAEKHGYGYYDSAAKEMARTLKKQKKQYKVIKLQCAVHNPGEPVYCLSKQQLAGTNSYHVGVSYNGMVYCTLHPYGIPEIIWIYDFECYHGVMEAEELGW